MCWSIVYVLMASRARGVSYLPCNMYVLYSYAGVIMLGQFILVHNIIHRHIRTYIHTYIIIINFLGAISYLSPIELDSAAKKVSNMYVLYVHLIMC